MRNSVEILQGANDPLIDDMTAYMREYIARAGKAKRGEFSDPEILEASKENRGARPSRRTYRRRY